MSKRKKRRERNNIYRATMVLMAVILIGLLYFINDKTNLISLTSIRNFKVQDLTKLMFWESFYTKDSEQVEAAVDYSLLKDDMYATGGNVVSAIMDGVIIKVERDSMVQLCDNGVSVVYEKMKEVHIKKDERVLMGDELGSMEEHVVLKFYVNDEQVSKEKALSLQ